MASWSRPLAGDCQPQSFFEPCAPFAHAPGTSCLLVVQAAINRMQHPLRRRRHAPARRSGTRATSWSSCAHLLCSLSHESQAIVRTHAVSCVALLGPAPTVCSARSHPGCGHVGSSGPLPRTETWAVVHTVVGPACAFTSVHATPCCAFHTRSCSAHPTSAARDARARHTHKHTRTCCVP